MQTTHHTIVRERYAITLNIGQDNNGICAPRVDAAFRAKRYSHLVSVAFRNTPFAVKPDTNLLLAEGIPGVNCNVTEPTDILSFDLVRKGGLPGDIETALRLALSRLCHDTTQGAIAATFEDVNPAGTHKGGILEGPQADKWGGDFNPDHFLPYRASVNNPAAAFA